LLQKHRHDGDQHSGQTAGFLRVGLLQPKGLAASTSPAGQAHWSLSQRQTLADLIRYRRHSRGIGP
jgi:hypothetical protein